MASFRDLVEHVAHLSYLNPDHLLFFRGQNVDYLNKAGSSTIYPGIYRNENSSKEELRHRFQLLDEAGRELIRRWADAKLDGLRDLRQKTYIQWSILQHYCVVETPLLDVTHSLRVACSFAQHGATAANCVVHVLGLPQVTNRISINSEHDLVNVRLLSICPPAALRPHFQEGFLAGTTDTTFDYDDKTDLDFRNRLIAKFAIPAGSEFWGRGFNSIPVGSLYPSNDKVQRLCAGLRERLSTEMQPGELGEFMKEWTSIEHSVLTRSRTTSGRNLSVRDAIGFLVESGEIDAVTAKEMEELRTYRNAVVHASGKVGRDSGRAMMEAARRIAAHFAQRIKT